VERDADHVIAAAFDQAEARDPQHRRCWVVLVDGAEHQLELIHAEAARRGVTCRYLENNAAYLHYDKALEAGWPIASGIVEGAARHLVADRLDITGSRWSVPGAEAVLTLRALISNGDFPQYWIFHTRRERERLYPRPDHHNYELLA
jgi:hypothetical protein